MRRTTSAPALAPPIFTGRDVNRPHVAVKLTPVASGPWRIITDMQMVPGYASGFRQPWRFTFDPKGRMILGDVGEDRFEEIDIVEKGRKLRLERS